MIKLSNKELIESLFKSIEDIGYHIVNKNYTSTYFLFKGEEDSICTFHIKEISGFKFGIWNTNRFDTIEYQIAKNGIGNTWADYLKISPKSELVFFTQYERDIDKFKPSRSNFLVGLYRIFNNSNNDTYEWNNVGELEYILHFMKHNKFKAYYHTSIQNEYIYNSHNYFYYLYIYLRDSFKYYKFKLKEYLKYIRHIKACKYFCKSLKNDCMILDRGMCWYPRIEICILFNDNKFDEKTNKKLNRFNNKWGNKTSVEYYFKCDKSFNNFHKHVKYNIENSKEKIIYCNYKNIDK